MAAADTAKLVASLSLDSRGFDRGLASANKGIGSFEKTLSKVGSRASKGFSDIGANLAKIGTIGAVGAGGLLIKSISLASDLNEQLNKTGAVFGKASDSVKEFSKTTADGLGISQAEALKAAGNFGNMFKTVGLADKQSAEFSTTLVTLAADMASFNDEDPSEMLDKLRSGLAGEAEPLRQFGVLLSEAEVKAEAYATGIAKTGEKLTEAQKVQARYSLILKQTAVQQGDFTRTNESFANLMRRIKGNLSDAGATIGTALLPKVVELSSKLNKLIVSNGPAIQKFADQLPAAFDKALAFAEKIPWATIGDGLEKAAFFTGKLFDAFLAMPPEVQTTLIALAGLNKLSGGAITGIVGELGKGLIKGVLGINAGVVNIKAATVNGVGGLPTPGGPAGGGVKGAITNVVKTAAVLIPPVLIAAELQPSVTKAIAGDNVLTNPDRWLPPVADPKPFWELMFQQQPKQTQALAEVREKMGGLSADERDTARKADNIAKAVASASLQNSAADAAVRAAVERAAAASRAAGQQAAAAIRDKDLSLSLTNIFKPTLNVSIRETIKTQITHKQYQKFIS